MCSELGVIMRVNVVRGNSKLIKPDHLALIVKLLP